MRSNSRTKRIEWGDCDPAGIIFNPRYFEMFDAATAGLFESALGINKREMLLQYQSVGIPLVRTNGLFLKPAHYGDDVDIESAVQFGRSSFQVSHRVTRKGEVCAECAETRVWVIRDDTGGIKSCPVPNEILKAFSK